MAAAGLPLLTALVGVGVSAAAITAISGPLELSSNVSALATMLGIAVGIDYALFIVTGYRSERADGYDAREAAARANGTAGSAVVFAGLTVVIALAGLVVVNLPILTAMGLAAAGAVVIAVLVATTLIPALPGFAGELVRGKTRKLTAPESGAAEKAKTGLRQRWISYVLRRPVKVLLLSVITLGMIALPSAKLGLGLRDDDSKATSSTQRQVTRIADSATPRARSCHGTAGLPGAVGAQVSAGGVPRTVRDAELTGKIAEVLHENSRGTYGAPRIHAVLQREGEDCGRSRAAGPMRTAELEGRHRRRRQATTIPETRAAARPDLVVRFFAPDPGGLDTRCCGDVTYAPTDEGWLYLATVLDIASRRVVG